MRMPKRFSDHPDRIQGAVASPRAVRMSISGKDGASGCMIPIVNWLPAFSVSAFAFYVVNNDERISYYRALKSSSCDVRVATQPT